MKKILITFTIFIFLAGCSTSGGIYKQGDDKDGEFSLTRTALSVLGVAAIIISSSRGGAGGYVQTGYAWDYLPASNQWVCRNKYNGEFSFFEKCAGIAQVDNWS